MGKRKYVDGIVSHGTIWRGTPEWHKLVARRPLFPRHLITPQRYPCDVCGERTDFLWITDDAAWKLLPRPFRKMRLCRHHYSVIVRRVMGDKKFKAALDRIETRYEKMKAKGAYRRIYRMPAKYTRSR